MTVLRLSFYLLICLFLGACQTTRVEKNETAELHMQIATSHIQNENYPLALKELLIAQELSPRNAAIQANLGYVYFMRERYDLSEQHFKRALSLMPNFTDAKNNLARVYIETSKNAQAEELLIEVLSDLTYVDFPRAQANYGILEFNRKKYKTAVGYFKRSLERDRENCITNVYLGRSYLELKENLLAVAQLEKSISFCQPLDLEDAHYYSAIALYRNGQKDRAIFRFEELIKLFPNSKYIDRTQKMLAVLKKGAL